MIFLFHAHHLMRFRLGHLAGLLHEQRQRTQRLTLVIVGQRQLRNVDRSRHFGQTNAFAVSHRTQLSPYFEDNPTHKAMRQKMTQRVTTDGPERARRTVDRQLAPANPRQIVHHFGRNPTTQKRRQAGQLCIV